MHNLRAFSLPFAVWMPRGFVAAVPESLEEAARIDGASRFTILWRILFPLVAPGLAATSVFSFITAWNDFVFAKTFILDTDHQTLPAALMVFFKPDENDWGGIMAASTLMTVPVLIFFVLVQRHPVSGLGGAVKDRPGGGVGWVFGGRWPVGVRWRPDVVVVFGVSSAAGVAVPDGGVSACLRFRPSGEGLIPGVGRRFLDRCRSSAGQGAPQSGGVPAVARDRADPPAGARG
jgi:hypothetical protein